MLGYMKHLKIGNGGSSGSNSTGRAHYLEQMMIEMQSNVSYYAHDIQHLQQQCEQFDLVGQSISSTTMPLIEEQTHLQNDVRILEATYSELELL